MAETDESYAAEIESEIAKLERDAERSQKSGNIEKALRLLERALAFKLEAYGPENPETASAWTSLTNNYNVYAMKHLQDEDFKASHSLLSKAKALLESPANVISDEEKRRLLAITYNNFACYYKKKNMLKSALTHAEAALEIEMASLTADTPSATHLNLCAILSQMGRHKHALEHARSALELLLADRENQVVAAPKELAGDEDEKTSLLAVCYHNMAVEQEYLRMYHPAIESYRQSYEIASRDLGPDHPTTLALQDSGEEAVSCYICLKMYKTPLCEALLAAFCACVGIFICVRDLFT
mmetsp:Transcript_19085/g.48832  ORF Transcript_19085/g.48832 Transcript_19085/m.48832 type:complete len:298 (+) Transcript_19085:83-976(+)